MEEVRSSLVLQEVKFLRESILQGTTVDVSLFLESRTRTHYQDRLKQGWAS